ncbi:MAG: hypothetical protein ACYTFG_20675, partial [Planctomycetota bacterium]
GESASTTLTFTRKVQPADDEISDAVEDVDEPHEGAPDAGTENPEERREPSAKVEAPADGPDTERLPAVRVDSEKHTSETPGRAPTGPWIPVGAVVLLLALVILFAEEIRGGLGLSVAERKESPPVEELHSAEATPNPVTRVEVAKELDRLERRLRDAGSMEGLEKLADRIDGLRVELGTRLGAVEGRNATLLEAVESLRKDLAGLTAAAAAGRKGGETGGEVETKEPELPPEEKLLREIMDALNKGE